MVGACGWLCCSHELVFGGSRGFRRPCKRAPPPTVARDYGQPLFVCPPPPIDTF